MKRRRRAAGVLPPYAAPRRCLLDHPTRPQYTPKPHRGRHGPHTEPTRLLTHPRRHLEEGTLAVRYLPRHIHMTPLAQHVDGNRLAHVVGAQDPHRLPGSSSLAAAGRHQDATTLEREPRIVRR